MWGNIFISFRVVDGDKMNQKKIKRENMEDML